MTVSGRQVCYAERYLGDAAKVLLVLFVSLESPS